MNPAISLAMWRFGVFPGAGVIPSIVLQPELDLHPTATLSVYLKALFVWREDTADGLYNTPGFLILPGSVNSQRYVGASPEVLITQQLGRHLTVSLGILPERNDSSL
jgi:hypothetical protein